MINRHLMIANGAQLCAFVGEGHYRYSKIEHMTGVWLDVTCLKCALCLTAIEELGLNVKIRKVWITTTAKSNGAGFRVWGARKPARPLPRGDGAPFVIRTFAPLSLKHFGAAIRARLNGVSEEDQIGNESCALAFAGELRRTELQMREEAARAWESWAKNNTPRPEGSP